MTFRRTFGPRRVVPPLVLAVVLMGLISSCVPSRTSNTEAVKSRTHLIEGDIKPPAFPTTNVPKPLLIEGLTYDFAVRPLDQDYWTPSKAEAKCAAKAIVERIGAQRISDLGYRVNTPGASINDIALTDDERAAVVDEFGRCVDMQEALAALFFGKGRIRSRAATCLSQVLASKGLLPKFVDAWIFGGAVDPFASNAALASALSTGSQVCINANDLNWPDLSVPGSDQGLIDSSAPAGSSSSAYSDDRPSADVSTSTKVGGD
ncbi:MAG TPA: hypothetical protein VL068_13475 [Microthrixaceae bacterium]|nr:hypothetical protein [Microthrixaceae bacterium]